MQNSWKPGICIFYGYKQSYSDYTMPACIQKVLYSSTVPREGSTQVFICLFPGVLWLWHFLYSVVGWLVVLRINVDLEIFQQYLDLEAGDN